MQALAFEMARECRDYSTAMSIEFLSHQ